MWDWATAATSLQLDYLYEDRPSKYGHLLDASGVNMSFQGENSVHKNLPKQPKTHWLPIKLSWFQVNLTPLFKPSELICVFLLALYLISYLSILSRVPSACPQTPPQCRP